VLLKTLSSRIRSLTLPFATPSQPAFLLLTSSGCFGDTTLTLTLPGYFGLRVHQSSHLHTALRRNPPLPSSLHRTQSLVHSRLVLSPNLYF
jgi:hypothetical protein